jgi:hypothetical protein
MGISVILDFSRSVQLRNLYSTRGASMEFSFVEKTQHVDIFVDVVVVESFSTLMQVVRQQNVSKIANSMLNSRCLHDFCSR